MLRLFTDSDCDVTPEIAKAYGAELISMPYSIDTKTVYPYVDFETFDDHAFYDLLRTGVLPNTSALGEQLYRDYFEPVFAAGDDILYVHFSAAMTVTFDVMNKVVDELLAKYPERKFYSVDTKGITTIALGVFYEVGDLYKAGKSAEEIVAWAKEEVDHFAMYFFADDLKFFKHSGRVSGLAATMGTLLGIRPIIYMDENGKMVSIGKEKGRAKALDRLVQYVEELGDNIKEHRVLIGHTDAPELAEELAQMLREKFGNDLRIELVPVNPTAGSHCGPNGAGICFHAIHR